MVAQPLWALAAVLWLAAGSAPAAETLEPEYWRKTSFALRFHEPRPGQDVPQEVHLHVSTDRGQTWNPYAQSPPSKRRFVYQAPGDGEYWFMLRTKFASGQYLPAGRPAAEVKVVVDTAPPELALDVREGAGGEVHLAWRVSDPNLDPETFRLEYKSTDLGGAWQRVALERAALQPGQTEYNGETTIVPLTEGAEHSLIVRADVADKAGNHTAREQPLRLSLARPAGPAVDGETQEDVPPEMRPTFPRRASTAMDRDDDRSYPVLDSSQGPLVPETIHPPITRRNEPPPEADAAPPLDTDARPRMSNKKQLELDYDIDSVGSAVIAEVELWCTRDGGRTWSLFGSDDDCRSPMRIQVDGEGFYGFRVVAATAGGQRGPAPSSGEPPDVLVGVDLTPPEAKFVSAELSADGDAEQLVVVWEAADERLAARPVALRYGETPHGPWTTIASGLENTGRYAWRLDERLPERVYLQLAVRDEAGNVGLAESPDAIVLRQPRPQSRVRDVRPVGLKPPRARRAMRDGGRPGPSPQ